MENGSRRRIELIKRPYPRESQTAPQREKDVVPGFSTGRESANPEHSESPYRASSCKRRVKIAHMPATTSQLRVLKWRLAPAVVAALDCVGACTTSITLLR
jgi:hypothetical protein